MYSIQDVAGSVRGRLTYSIQDGSSQSSLDPRPSTAQERLVSDSPGRAGHRSLLLLIEEWHGFMISGDQILEWNGIDMIGRTYEEVQWIISQPHTEIEIVVKP